MSEQFEAIRSELDRRFFCSLERFRAMGAFTKWGRIAAAAGSVALLSVETVLLESPKPVEKREAEEKPIRAVAVSVPEEQKQALPSLQQDAKAAQSKQQTRSKAPRMAPQFDGLNFYETFIGCAQR